MSIKLNDRAIQRRDFLLATAAAITVTGLEARPLTAADSSGSTRVPLGLDGHSLRSMKWKATQLIEFAAEQRLDAVLLNNLNYFESLEESHLLKVKELASKHDMRIYVGAGGICKNAAKFSDKWGNAEAMLATGIRVASTVGSPVVNVRIGSIADRFLSGGIQPRIDEAVRVLKASSQRAKDAGVKFGFENHAADLRSEELLELIEEVGTDVCGVMLDPGNGLWAMEDPMVHLQALAPYVVCNSLRDYMVWESAEGATFQWTAVGDGLMEVPSYVQTLAKSNPGMPIFVESISNSARPIPFLTNEHWEGYPNLKAADIVDFLKLCRRGHEIEIDQPEPGMDKKEFDRQHQRTEFLKSIEYLRQHCGAGLKTKGGAVDSEAK
jgi:sugar phosphate isomerase/epimerase